MEAKIELLTQQLEETEEKYRLKGETVRITGNSTPSSKTKKTVGT